MPKEIVFPTFEEYINTPKSELDTWQIMFTAAFAFVLESPEWEGMSEEFVYNMLRTSVAIAMPPVMGMQVKWEDA